MNTPNDPTLDESRATEAERGHMTTEASTLRMPRRRMSGRAVVLGVSAGLAAAIGAGFAVQSASASLVDEAPMGAQLPWGDSNSGDSGRAGELGRPHDGRVDGAADRMRDRMHAQDRAGKRDHSRLERMGGRGVMGLRQLIGVAADELGVTIEELIGEMKGGKSISDIAGERNVPVEDVVDAIVDDVVDDVTERITDLVNRSIELPRSDTPNS